jgi:hypothetical protein
VSEHNVVLSMDTAPSQQAYVLNWECHDCAVMLGAEQDCDECVGFGHFYSKAEAMDDHAAYVDMQQNPTEAKSVSYAASNQRRYSRPTTEWPRLNGRYPNEVMQEL